MVIERHEEVKLPMLDRESRKRRDQTGKVDANSLFRQKYWGNHLIRSYGSQRTPNSIKVTPLLAALLESGKMYRKTSSVVTARHMHWLIIKRNSQNGAH
jgi:hypothetical protein